jgi:hypothetical protein
VIVTSQPQTIRKVLSGAKKCHDDDDDDKVETNKISRIAKIL